MNELGAIGPTRERLELAQRAAEMRARGAVYREIAAELDISYSYAHELIVDADGSKARARKDGYRGVCERCGGPTTGSAGRGKVHHCYTCAVQIRRESRHWTRERVIDAIQRFAADHGRPPNATEWIGANPAKGYPARSSVYRNPGSKHAPFANRPTRSRRPASRDHASAITSGHPASGSG